MLVSRSAALAASVAVAMLPIAASAQQDPIERLMDIQDSASAFEDMAEDVAGFASEQEGFSAAHVAAWRVAATAAFDRDALVGAFTDSLRANLSAESIDAVLAFEGSPLGEAFAAASDAVAAVDVDETPGYYDEIRQYLDTVSAEEADLYLALFEAQGGPELVEALMEGVYMLMNELATPTFGPELAAEWVALAEAEGLGDIAAEELFLGSVDGYRQLELTQLQELIAAAREPAIVAYFEGYTQAFRDSYLGAAGQMGKRFADALGS